MLIVKDGEDIHKNFKNYLLEWEHTVIEAGAGGRVLLALDRLIPELVLLEISLTDLFFFDFVKKIAVEKKTMAWRLLRSLLWTIMNRSITQPNWGLSVV